MMRKKIVALMLGFVLVFSLAACGSSSYVTVDADAETTEESEEAEGDEDGYEVTLIVKQTDEHFERVIAGAQAYAAENGNVTVTVQSPASTTDFETQTNMIETVLANNSVDAMILAPMQADVAVNRSEGSEKTIIAVDTDFDASEKKAYVGTMNEDAAYAAGQEAVALAAEAGADEPTAIIFTGNEGDATHEERVAGFTAAVEEAGGEINMVEYAYGNADAAADAMEELLEYYPHGVDIIFGTTDEMILAAIEVIEESGNTEYDSTVYCGFNGDTDAITAIQEGILDVTAAQNAYEMGYLAVKAAVEVLDGWEVESSIDSGSVTVTADNAEEYIASLEELGLWSEE